jgi:hypothetical protein
MESGIDGFQPIMWIAILQFSGVCDSVRGRVCLSQFIGTLHTFVVLLTLQFLRSIHSAYPNLQFAVKIRS